MHKLADLIEKNAEELAALESLDNGKPVTSRRRVDVAGASAHLRYYAGWPTRSRARRSPSAARTSSATRCSEPVGVCGQIIPWNFPLLMAAWKMAPALAAGCTVVLKPAEQTPLTALRARPAGPGGRASRRASSTCSPASATTGAAMVEHPGIDKIAFTGSTAVGREIGAKAGETLKRVTLELGGKSPNIILPDADLEAAIKGSFMGIFFNTGQAATPGRGCSCTRTSTTSSCRALAEAAKGASVGPGLDQATQFGPGRVAGAVRPRHVATSSAAARRAPRRSPAATATGRQRLGYFIDPTLFTTSRTT